tara:strand:+ start:273 stop:1721 length:1449 start_codon:yes stop_codon:yes gene_type:complete
MAVEKNIKINVEAKGAIKQVDSLEKGVKETSQAAKDSKKSFSIMSAGVKGVGLAFKALGVGLIVAAFTKLADMLQQNQAVIDKVNVASAVLGDIFTKIGTVIVSVVKGLGLLGKAIGKVLRGEFREAADLAKDSFNGVKEAVVGNSESFSDFIKNAKESAKETVRFAKALVNLRNEVKLAEAQQRQLQLTFQKEAEIQRQIRDDISLTFEERIAANTKLGEVLDKQFAEEQALAQKKIDLAAIELSRNKTNIDLQVALINAKTEMADLDERITGQRSEQLTNLKGLEKEQADAIQATADAEAKRLADAKAASDKAVKIAEEEAKKKIEIEKALAITRRSIVANSLGQVASLLGKESKAGKALAVGQALINTYSAAAAALAPPPVGAGPIFGPIAAIGAVAAGMANVKQIMSTKLPGAEGGGGGGPSPSVPQPSGGMGALDVNMEAVDQPTLGGTQPAQAYVVENDISNAQALQQELDIQATL